MLTDHQPHGDGLVAHGFIKRLAERGHSLYVAAEEVSLDRALPPTVRVFPLRRRFGAGGLSRLEYMWEVRKLYRRLERAVDFDLIHQLNPVYTGISLALSPTNKPVVLGPYVAEWPTDPDAISSSWRFARVILQSVKKSVARAQQRDAAALLVTTEEARRRVVKGEKRRSATFVLPHGVDSDFFNPLPAGEKESNGSIKILFLANISERKGIFDMLNAFESLVPRFSNVTLWIAGGGEDEQSARAIASKLECAERVRFLGRQNRQQTLELLQRAHIYCLPSHGEPFGMTVVEAMSCGLPLVVTNSGGVRWIVDNDGGIRVPEKAPEELAQALEELITAPTLRRQMGAHNREKILRQFTWDRVIDRLEEIYLLAMRGHAGADREAGTARCPAERSAEVGAYE